MFVPWFTWMISLFFHVLKKNIESMYIWYLISLLQSKYHVKCKKCELFSEKVEFLGHTVSAAGVGVV